MKDCMGSFDALFAACRACPDNTACMVQKGGGLADALAAVTRERDDRRECMRVQSKVLCDMQREVDAAETALATEREARAKAERERDRYERILAMVEECTPATVEMCREDVRRGGQMANPMGPCKRCGRMVTSGAMGCDCMPERSDDGQASMACLREWMAMPTQDEAAVIDDAIRRGQALERELAAEREIRQFAERERDVVRGQRDELAAAWEWLRVRPWLSVCLDDVDDLAAGNVPRWGVLRDPDHGDGWIARGDTPLSCVQAAMKEAANV